MYFLVIDQELLFDNLEILKEVRMITTCIPIESFFDPLLTKVFWPEYVARDPAFLGQIKQRQTLINRLENALSLPRPDCTTQEFMAGLYQNEAIELYALLTELLETGPDYQRIVLYLPFELLPDQTTPYLKRGVQAAALRFKHVYMVAWRSLLDTHDVRANFVDGDVTEEDQLAGSAPRVVKAAHLIPKLVERDLLKTEEVITLMEESRDPVLKNSIADALPVLMDFGLLCEADLQRMRKSPDRLVRNMVAIIAARAKLPGQTANTFAGPVTTVFVQKMIIDKASWIAADDKKHITAKRRAWLSETRKNKILEEIGGIIAAAIANGGLDEETITDFLTSDGLCQQALIEGIRIAIESTTRTDIGMSLTLCRRYENALLWLWQNSEDDTKELVARALRRFHRLGVFSGNQFEQMGITIPNLAGPLTDNLAMMEKEIRDLKQMVTSIELDPELSQMIYPVVLISGSRLNGYARPEADIDIAILVKPGTPFVTRPKLQKLLRTASTNKNINCDEIVEFWLNENGDSFSIREFDGFDVRIGQRYWTHILFGAAWIGEENILRELFAKLLVPYLSDSTGPIMGRESRGLCLEDMEQSALQYRLMHKGYDRFFPAYGGIHTPHSDGIDDESMFWDCGFRQLATKLFCRRVFLLKLQMSKIQTN